MLCFPCRWLNNYRNRPINGYSFRLVTREEINRDIDRRGMTRGQDTHDLYSLKYLYRGTYYFFDINVRKLDEVAEEAKRYVLGYVKWEALNVIGSSHFVTSKRASQEDHRTVMSLFLTNDIFDRGTDTYYKGKRMIIPDEEYELNGWSYRLHTLLVSMSVSLSWRWPFIKKISKYNYIIKAVQLSCTDNVAIVADETYLSSRGLVWAKGALIHHARKHQCQLNGE